MKYQKSFPTVAVIIAVAAIAGVAVLWGNLPDSYKSQIYNSASKSSPSARTSVSQIKNRLNQEWGQGHCTGRGPVELKFSPVSLSDLKFIIPMGEMVGAHVTPVDHQYWYPTGAARGSGLTSNPEHYTVYAPADGNIVSLEHRTEALVEKMGGGNAPAEDDYRLIIQHSCSFFTYLIHINKVKPEILAQAKFRQYDPVLAGASTRIPIKAGEVIGTTGDHQFDFAVINTDKVLKGFITPGLYQGEPWKIFTADPFDYFKEPLKNQLLAKLLKTQSPLGGKIDYDIDGRAVGNWFRTGTNGYQGASQNRYWDGHLTLAYDSIDTDKIIISTGNFNGRAGQFMVVGNAPDPKDISAGADPVKYELVPYDRTTPTGEVWDQASFIKDLKVTPRPGDTAGVLMIQMTDKRKLKVEAFPGQKPAEITSFTSNAAIYER